MQQRQAIEFLDRVRVSKRGSFIAAVAALTAAGVAVVVLMPITPIYRTSAVVGTDPGAQSANERVDFVSDVSAAISQPSVLKTVADQVGVSASSLKSSIKVKRVNESNLILVTYESHEADGEKASSLVKAVPQAALEFLKRGEIERATAAVDRLNRQLSDATAAETAAHDAVTGAVEKNGFVPPDVGLDSMQRRLAGLQAQLVAPAADGDPNRVTLQQEANNLRAAIGPATALAVTYADLVGAQNKTISHRATVEGELQDASDLLQQSQVLPSVVVQRIAVKHSNLRSALVQIVTIAAIAAVLALLAMSWWERGQRGPADIESTPP